MKSKRQATNQKKIYATIYVTKDMIYIVYKELIKTDKLVKKRDAKDLQIFP